MIQLFLGKLKAFRKAKYFTISQKITNAAVLDECQGTKFAQGASFLHKGKSILFQVYSFNTYDLNSSNSINFLLFFALMSNEEKKLFFFWKKIGVPEFMDVFPDVSLN